MAKTAIITSSETFGWYVFHPGKWLAVWADGKTIAGHKIHSLVFPSITRIPPESEDPGTTIVNTAIEDKASVIISFGLSSVVKGFRLERSATNWSENKYCQIYENGYPIDPDRPIKEKVQIDLSKWDIRKMEQLFRKNNLPLEHEISDDPGQYSCNAWMYRTVIALKKLNISIPYLFVHTACTEESIELISDFPRDLKMTIKKEYLKKALDILLQCYNLP